MPPNFHYSLSRSQVPCSLIPALPITAQQRIIQSGFNSLRNIETSDQQFFLRIISQVKENNFEEIFNTIKPQGKNLWKYQNLCFIYNPKVVEYDLFMEKKGLSILKKVRKTLLLKTTDWVCLINQETTYMFTLSNNGFLLWSPILQSIAPYLLASLLSNNSILDSIDDSWRWDFLEKEKSQLLKFVIQAFKKPIENKETFVSRFFFLMLAILKTKEKLLLSINKEINSLKSSDDLKDLTRISLFNPKLFRKQFFESSLEPSELKIWKEIFDNFSLTEQHWILDVPPVLFLEIIPQIKNEGDGQKFGEFYTPIALAEVIVTRSFETYIDQGLTKPITNMKVFDPAMGTGILLMFAMEWLVNFMISNTSQDDAFIDLRRKILSSCINGMDIEEDSISIYDNFVRSFYLFGMENEELQLSVEQKDFIDSFVTRMKFKQVFPKFDVIISNPPYLAFHSRFTKNFPLKVDLKTLRQFIPIFSGKRDNTYLMFLGICLQQFLAPKGVVGFVIDHSFLDLPSYEKIREYLLSNYHVGFILANYSYRKTAIVDLSLLVLRNIQNNLPTVWQETLNEETQKVPKKYFFSRPNFIFRYQETPSFLSHFDDVTIPLGNIASISCGLEYGGLLKTHFLSSNAKEGFYKCIDGSNGLSQPYSLFWTSGQKNSFVRFDKEYEKYLQNTNQDVSRTNKKVILISGHLERFLTDKIILRQTAPKFIATLDKQKYLTLRNTHLIYNPKPPYSLFLILGILCSSLGNWIGERFNIIRKPQKESSRYPQIRLNDLKKFPIIDINQITDNSMINQVEIAVRECLNFGESITAALISLWVIFQEAGIVFTSQRHFLRACFSRDILTRLPSKILWRKAKQWDLVLHEELAKLSAKRKVIDSIVFKLYNINHQDQREIKLALK